MGYIERLIKDCNTAQKYKSKPDKEFCIDNLTDLDAFSDLTGVKQAIYIIEEVGGDPDKTYRAFLDYKAKGERACPKDNAASPVMYVGSSTTGLRGRIKQHLGKANSKGTYALHLKYWFSGKYKITIRVYKNVSRQVLQIIEDDLSEQKKPAFGKQGGNNK